MQPVMCCRPSTASSTAMPTGAQHACLHHACRWFQSPRILPNKQLSQCLQAQLCCAASGNSSCLYVQPCWPAASKTERVLCHVCRESLLCPGSQEHSGSASPCDGSRYPSVGRSKSVGRGMGPEDSHMSGYCYGEHHSPCMQLTPVLALLFGYLSVGDLHHCLGGLCSSSPEPGNKPSQE